MPKWLFVATYYNQPSTNIKMRLKPVLLAPRCRRHEVTNLFFYIMIVHFYNCRKLDIIGYDTWFFSVAKNRFLSTGSESVSKPCWNRLVYFIKNIWIMERKRSGRFRRIFTVAFLLFLAPVGSSSPAGQSLTFTQPNLT